jgi:hypothetical protein
MRLESDIADLEAGGAAADKERARALFTQLREALSARRVRAAEPDAAGPSGTLRNGSTPVCDLVRGEVVQPTAERPLVIPENAVVVVPGARAVTVGKGPQRGPSLATPVIIKDRDSRTDTRTELEAWIR